MHVSEDSRRRLTLFTLKSCDIIRLLGTPDEEAWPGVTQLPDYKGSFPQWKAKDIKTAVAGLNDVSTDLLSVGVAV